MERQEEGEKERNTYTGRGTEEKMGGEKKNNNIWGNEVKRGMKE